MSEQEDFDLERKIEASSLQFLAATTPSQRRKIWANHKLLLAQRSAAQVEAMERDRGIYTEGK